MATIDLSQWTGKPPPRSSSRAGPLGSESENDDGSTGDRDGGVDIDSDNSSEDDATNSAPGSEILASAQSQRSTTADSQPAMLQSERDQHISVDIPPLDEDIPWERLPGYYTVSKVLKEIEPDRFLLRLASGEVEVLSVQSLKDFEHSSEALELFYSTNMDRSRRSTRRPAAQANMVDWTSLDISDAEEGSPVAQKATRRSMQSRMQTMDDRTKFEDQESATDGDDKESDVEFIGSLPAGRRSSRLALIPRSTSVEDDESSSSSFDDIPSKRRKTKSTIIPVRSRPHSTPIARSRQASTQPVAGTRRSERARTTNRRDMRERHEDEISSHSEEEVGPKVVATKEEFEEFSTGDPFRARHNEHCDTCAMTVPSREKGPLVFCQGCTSTYHHSCLGNRGSREHLVTKVGEGRFVLQCRRCVGSLHNKDITAPHLGKCASCNELGPTSRPFRARLTTREEQLRREENAGVDPITQVDSSLVNAVENVMFRCPNCQRAWHIHHLPSRDHLQQEEGNVADDEAFRLRFDYYHGSGACKDCIEHKHHQIESIVAWRPTSLEAYISGSTVDMIEDSQKEYLIKWKEQSFFRTDWMPGDWVYGIAASASRVSFFKKPEHAMPKMTTKDAIPEDWLRVDIVFDVKYTSVVSNRTKEIDFARVREVDSAYVKFKGLGYEYAIWEKPPSFDEKERWAEFKMAYENWVLKHYVYTPNSKTLRRHLQAVRARDFEKELETKEQPKSLSGGQMMKYQVEGLNWLYYQWFKNQNCILADEMGLGKTIQLIGFFALLVQEHKCWPFLIVVPNSTCLNWRREIQKWAPSLRAVTYYGSARARKMAQDYELFPKLDDYSTLDKRSVKDLRAHIVISSYESVSDEKSRVQLQKVQWAGLVVDEGQRLKNDKNLTYDSLSRIRFPYKVLLTGTPLQNNARELFNLLHFLDPDINAALMDAKYESLTKEKVAELHETIRPFFLRRTKLQVLDFLPPLAQIILPVSMSVLQKKIYKSILAQNPALLRSIFRRTGDILTKDRVNLNNVLMQLRKTLCHPFVYNREVEERSHDMKTSHRNLVEASSKLQLLDLMLPKLSERGHRVLIFSQFLDNLDIVEDFLDGLGLQHRRLDGSVNSLEKQKRIDEFNAPDSPYFAFLLSTRAGGVGINLATADTVIIMDPDFNPHQDIQALSRAHRIGQENKVLVFQLMTRDSAEEKIMQIGKKKMVLDHILIQQLGHEDDAGMDLESILRHGADALFAEDDTNDIVYDSASVDKLLDRSQVECTDVGADKSAESQFSFARVWANAKATMEDSLGESAVSTPHDPTVWDKILEEREKIYAEEAKARAQAFGRGKRKRNNVDYIAQHVPDVDSSPKRSAKDENDTDFQSNHSESDADDNSVSTKDSEGTPNKNDGPTAVPKPRTTKARPFARVKIPTGHVPYPDHAIAQQYEPIGPLAPEHHCHACQEVHHMGWCRLKIAGVEHCGLCGIAHIGHGRTCPHLNSETQVYTMLSTLTESTEDRDLVEKATKYLRMIRGDLVQRKRNAERKQIQGRQNVNFQQFLPTPDLRVQSKTSGNQPPPHMARPPIVNVPPSEANLAKQWLKEQDQSRHHDSPRPPG